jgi:GNAT superfamily N-acetyltransferase
MVSLEPTTAHAFGVAQRRLWQAYRDSWIKSGASPDEAAAKEAAVRESLLPGGELRPGHHPLDIVSDGEVVGFLWLAERVPGDWYIYDIDLAERWQGQGVGRAALAAAEEMARSRGGVKMELNVFAFNTTMEAMVRAAGYQPVTTIVSKPLR